MNVSRENLSDLELSIKIELNESDYAENVSKQLKRYRQQASIPGFRKGMAPMSLIQRMYKSAIVSDEVSNLLSQNLYKYIDDEKLELLGSPLSNEEKTGAVDFEKQKDFTFYFDAALMPDVKIDWSKITTKLTQIKVPAKDVDAQITDIANRYGKFETPEQIGENDHVYGKAVEQDKKGGEKEGGVSVFISFNMSDVKDADIKQMLIGKKNEEKVIFNAFKAFGSAFIEKNFRLEAAVAKKFKSDIELSISGCSRVIPHEMNEELYKLVFPEENITEEDKFRKAVSKSIEKANNEQSQILYVNQVRKQLLDNFDTPLPESFMKRWILSRDDKGLTPETLDAEWAEKYLPSLKWEILDATLNKIKPIEPTRNEIVDYVKDILKRNDRQSDENESAEDKEKRIESAAQTIASDRNNVSQIVDRLYSDKTFALFKEMLKPEVEKITAKEFSERVKADSQNNTTEAVADEPAEGQQSLDL